jgi:hypothetical protein
LKNIYWRNFCFIFKKKRDRSGSITTKEFASVLENLGFNVADEDIIKITGAMDSNSDGEISFEEFARVFN